MKLGAIRGQLVELMQKFVPRSHVGIFFNERTQCAPLDCKLMFWSLHIGMHLGSFSNYMELGAKQGELVQLMQKFVARSHVKIFRNERTQSAPLDPKLIFWYVANYWDAFGIVW